MYQEAGQHSGLESIHFFLLFLESTKCMCCSLIPSTHGSVSVFNNPRKEKCLVVKNGTSIKQMPSTRHSNCALIYLLKTALNYLMC